MLRHQVTAAVIRGVISGVIGRAVDGGGGVVSGVISGVIRGGGAHAGVIKHRISGVISEQLVVPRIKSGELGVHHIKRSASREQALEAEIIDGKVRIKGRIKD